MATNNTIKKNILLVEDDEELAELIQDYLERAEFNVSVEHNGLIAADRVLQDKPDLVILDLMLPGKDGIAICRDVRPFFDGHILMLTASNESVDQILGLEIGADDFVQKPVEPRILLARIRALFRRSGHEKQPIIESASIETDSMHFENLLISPATRQVKVNGHQINLANPEYDVLLLLAENRGKILSRNDIFVSLRGIEYDGQNRLVDITISQLRAKLACDGQSDRHIKTIRNKGYLFVEEF